MGLDENAVVVLAEEPIQVAVSHVVFEGIHLLDGPNDCGTCRIRDPILTILVARNKPIDLSGLNLLAEVSKLIGRLRTGRHVSKLVPQPHRFEVADASLEESFGDPMKDALPLRQSDKGKAFDTSFTDSFGDIVAQVHFLENVEGESPATGSAGGLE